MGHTWRNESHIEKKRVTFGNKYTLGTLGHS